MFNHRALSLLAILAFSPLVACDGGDDEAARKAAEAAKQAEEASKKSAEEMQKAMEQVPQGMQGMAKGMQEMMKGMQQMANSRQMVEPLHFRELQATFPEPGGWERGKPTGQTINMPYKMSQAEAKYSRGDARVKISAVDGGWHPMMLAPYAMFLNAGFERETESGYEKSTVLAGNPGWEKWDDQRKHGEMNIVVGERFLVQLNGDNLSNIDELRTFVDALDLKALAEAAAKSPAAEAAPQ